MVVESQLAQLSNGSRSYSHLSGSTFPPNDRALIAVGQSGSSLTISLEDVTAIWLAQLDLNNDLLPTQTNVNHSLTSSFAPYSSSQIKLEHNTFPSPVENSSGPPAALLVPSPNIYYSTNPTSCETPHVTPGLVALLPSSPFKRRRLCSNVEEILKINPCFNWKHFRERLDGLFVWAVEAENLERATCDSGRRAGASTSKADAARAILFGETTSALKKPAPCRPTVSFFAAVAGAFALGAQANRDQSDEEASNMVVDIYTCGRSPTIPKRPQVSHLQDLVRKSKTTSTISPPPLNTDNNSSSASGSPAALFALGKNRRWTFGEIVHV